MLNDLIKSGKDAFSIHRLDRNTLGLVLFAKTAQVQKQLISEFKNGNVEKLYYAEVCGETDEHKILHGYLEKNKEESLVKIYSNPKPNSVKITTEYTVVKSSGNTKLLSVKIKDGKTQAAALRAYVMRSREKQC